MSKAEKIILIVALAMLPVGIAVAILGFRFAGTKGWALDLKTMQYADTSEIVEKTIDLDEFDDLEVRMDSTDMTVTTGDSYQIYYRLPKNREPELTQQGKKLTIKHPEQMNFMVFDFDTDNEYIELTVPANDKKYNVDFRASSGDYTIDKVAVEGLIKLTSGELRLRDFDARDLNVEISSGDVYLDGVNLDQLSAKQTSGTCHFNDAKITDLSLEASSGDYVLSNIRTDSISCTMTSGEITMQDVEVNRLEGKMTSGKFEMNLIGDAKDYDYNITMTSGDFELNGTDYEKQYRVENGNAKKIAIKATSGDIELNFR